MTYEKWQPILAKEMDFARAALLKRGTLPATFSLYLPDRKVRSLIASFYNPEQKAATLRYITAEVIAHNAEAMVFMTEAWAAEVGQLGEDETAQDFLKKHPTITAREQPNRIEVIHGGLAYYDKNGARQGINVMGKIRRDEAKKVIDVTGIEFSNPADVILGAVIQVMPDRRAGDETRRRLLSMLLTQGQAMRETFEIVSVIA
jgi:hypothetical protein